MSDDDQRVSREIINRLSPVEPSKRLKQLVAEIPNSHPRAQVISFPFKNAWVPAVSLAAAALMGLFVGRNWALEAPVETTTVAQISETDEPDYDDLDTDQLTKDADFSVTQQLDEPDLETLLVFATTGNFEANDWAQWEGTGSAPPAEPTEETR